MKIEICIALISIVLGGLIGYFFDVKKEKRAQNIKWHEIYTNFSQEIAIVLAPFLNLSLRPKIHTIEELNKIKKEISCLYYRYYPFLPHDILLELNCMHSCLQSEGKVMYRVVGKSEHKTMSRCKNPKDIINFCHDATLIDVGLHKLDNIIQNGEMPVHLRLNFQARMVIRKIDVFFSNEKMFKWTKHLKKKTVYALDLK